LSYNETLFSYSASEFSVRDSVEKYSARIEIRITDQKLDISGKFVNNTDESPDFTYKLTTKKSGKSGTSSNVQSGKFKAVANSEILVSNVGLDFDESNEYIIILEVYSGSILIAEDSITSSGKDIRVNLNLIN
jgi:hypothetical protein